MTDRPGRLVSIILTTLNSEQFLVRSIESCLNQTHAEIELLIVDGGSRDRTLEIVKSYADPRIRLIHQEANAGKLPGAINLGMAEARGEYMTWTQADCWYELQAIETMLDYLDAHPGVAMVYTDYWEVDESGAPVRYQAVNPPDAILVDDVVRVCFLFRRAVYEHVGPQQTQYYPVHDVPWRARVAQYFQLEPLHVPLMHYTLHPHSLTDQVGPWSLQRLAAKALYQEGHFSPRAHRARLASIDVDQAYEAFILEGDYRAFWSHAWSGIRRDGSWLGNRGLWKLMAWSLLPGRAAYRNRLYAQWVEKQATSQASLRNNGHHSTD